MDHPVGPVRSVHLGVTDLERAAGFYRDAWGLVPVTADNGTLYLRAAGRAHHVLRLSAAPKPTLLGIEFAAADRATLDHLAADLSVDHPAPRPAAAGGGLGITVLSPDGIAVGVSADVAEHDSVLPDHGLPTKLTHVVINSPDVQTQLAFWIDRLGFTLSDSTARQYFLRSAADHHSLAVAIGTHASLHHVAFEVSDFDSQMYASGRMLEHGYPIEWGPGRHGPGNNIFCYFISPDGFAVEYTTEVEQIDETIHYARDDAYWASLPRRPCRWGLAGRPSARMAEAFSGVAQ